jgi:hypothetical protein
MNDGEKLTTADLAGQTAQREDAAQDSQTQQQNVEVRDGGDHADLEPLLGADEAESFRQRWQSIQTGFVDEPQAAVQQADALVAELMQRLAQTFHEERESLESQLSSGSESSTEDLRVGLQRYRSFFERLLST